MNDDFSIEQLRRRIEEEALFRDRFRLRKRLRRLTPRDGERLSNKPSPPCQPTPENRRKPRTSRRDNLPLPTLNADLPIAEHADEIAAAMRSSQVVIVQGETGSGKSTQLPQIALQAGFGAEGMIGHTQPRRLAARTLAGRIAKEMNVKVGGAVGYKVRFGDETSDETYVKLLTDGMLLAEIAGDRFLDRYEMIILDEAHERSLNVDFLLAYLRRLLTKRRDLCVVITSATLEAARLQKYFLDVAPNVPIVRVGGRGYPIETQYAPPKSEEGRNQLAARRGGRSGRLPAARAGRGAGLYADRTRRRRNLPRPAESCKLQKLRRSAAVRPTEPSRSTASVPHRRAAQGRRLHQRCRKQPHRPRRAVRR